MTNHEDRRYGDGHHSEEQEDVSKPEYRDPNPPPVVDPLPKTPFFRRFRLPLALLLVFVLAVGTSLGVPVLFEDDVGFEGTHVEGDMNEYVRQVYVEAKVFYTPEEIKNFLRQNTPGFNEADQETRDEVEEAWDEQLADLTNDDGLIPQDNLAQQFQLSPTQGLALLAGDHVVMPSSLASQALSVHEGIAERTQVRVLLIPDSDMDDADDWQYEELFSGTVEEFVADSRVHIDPESGIAHIERSDRRNFADPEGDFYNVVDFNSVEELSTIVFPGVLGEVNTSESGEVVGVLDDEDLVLVRGAFTSLGTPVFLVHEDGELLLVGILVGVDQNTGIGIVKSVNAVEDLLPEKGEDR